MQDIPTQDPQLAVTDSASTNPSLFFVTTFYFFKPLHPWKEVANIIEDLETEANRLSINGLMILGPEGLNSTLCSHSNENLNTFKAWLKSYFQLSELLFKDSISEVEPFPKLKVKYRKEICTIGGSRLSPHQATNNHLTPEEWNLAIQSKENVILLDTRNFYEYRIGTFRGAVNPAIEQFSDFPAFFEQQGFKKDQKVLMFCTGGIRCEKAMVDLQSKGYNQVYQLEGGILNYLSQYPDSEFEGECFVFDNRVAVDQNLAPTKQYKLCPHCGQPAKTALECIRCDSPAVICQDCACKAVIGETCSKNCAHHYRLQPGQKGKRQLRPWLKPLVAAKT